MPKSKKMVICDRMRPEIKKVHKNYNVLGSEQSKLTHVEPHWEA